MSRESPHLEAELLKMEQGALGKKWSKKLVVLDGDKGTIRYHRSKDDRWSQPRKIFQLAQLVLDVTAEGPKRSPHAFELRHRTTGYSMILACDRGKAEHRAWCEVLTPLVHSLKSFHTKDQPPANTESQNDFDDEEDEFPEPLEEDDVEKEHDTTRLSALAELRVAFPRESDTAIAAAYDNQGSIEAARVKLRSTETLRRRFPQITEAAIQNALNDAHDNLDIATRALENIPHTTDNDATNNKNASHLAINTSINEPRPSTNGMQSMQTPTRSSPAHSFSSVGSREKAIDTIFYAGDPLGIQLRLTPARNDGSRDVIILAVKPTCPARDRLRAGDLLYAADDEPIPPVTSKNQFGDLTKKLARHPRPLKLKFLRKVRTSKNNTPEKPPPQESQIPPLVPTQQLESQVLNPSERKPSFVSDITEDPPLDTYSTTWEPIGTTNNNNNLTIKPNINDDQPRVLNLDSSRRQFQVEFLDFPLGFKLVLAQYKKNRLAIQLNEVAPSCTHFSEIQVLDELLAVDDDDSFSKPLVRNDSFDLATSLLASAVRAKRIPLSLRFSRKAAVFSVDFPKRPLGIQLRLTTIDKRKAIIVKHHKTEEEDNQSKPQFFIPGDDHLIAVHGSLLPRQCTTDDFHNLMQRLQDHEDWPLRLTFWRRSLGSLDDLGNEEEEACHVEIPESKALQEEITEEVPLHIGVQNDAEEDSDEQEEEEASPVIEQEENEDREEEGYDDTDDDDDEEAISPFNHMCDDACKEEDDDQKEEENMRNIENDSEDEVPEETLARESIESADVPADKAISPFNHMCDDACKEEDDDQKEEENMRNIENDSEDEVPEETLARELIESADVPADKEETSDDIALFVQLKEPTEPQVTSWNRASESSEHDTAGLIQYRAADTVLGNAAATAMRRVDTLNNVVITQEKKEIPTSASKLILPERLEENVKTERRAKTAPARMSKLAYFLETGTVPMTEGIIEEEKKQEELDEATPSEKSSSRYSSNKVEAMTRELEQRIEKEHPAYKQPSTSSDRRNEAQEIIDAVIEENQSSITQAAKRKLTTSRPRRLSSNISEEECPSAGTHERLSAIFDSNRSQSSISPVPKEIDDEVSDDEIAPIADSSIYRSEEASSSLMLGSPESDRRNRSAELEEELEAVRAELERTSYELVQTRRALEEEQTLAFERVAAAEAAAEARVAFSKDELAKAHAEAQHRLELFEEALRRANPSNWYSATDYEKAKAEADAARQEADFARAELEQARLREENAVRAARDDVADAKKQLQDKEDQAAAVVVETTTKQLQQDEGFIEDEFVTEFVQQLKSEEESDKDEPSAEEEDEMLEFEANEVHDLIQPRTVVDMEKEKDNIHQSSDIMPDDQSDASSAIDEVALRALASSSPGHVELYERELAAARAAELERIEIARLELERELAEAKQNALQSMENELERERRELAEAKRRELEILKTELQAETKRELEHLRSQAKVTLDQIEVEKLRGQQISPQVEIGTPQSVASLCDDIAAMYFENKLSGVELAREAMRNTHTLPRPPSRVELITACMQRPQATGNIEWCGRREVGATLMALAAVDDDESGGWIAVLDEIVRYCDEVLNFAFTPDGESFLVAYFDRLYHEEIIPREAFEAWRGRSVDHLATKKNQRRPAAALTQTDNWFAVAFGDSTPYSQHRTRRRSGRHSSPLLLLDSAKSRSAGGSALNENTGSDDDLIANEASTTESSSPRKRRRSELAEMATLVAEAVDTGPIDETASRLEGLVGAVDAAGFRAWRALALVQADSGKTEQQRAKARAQLAAAQSFFQNQGLDDVSLDQRLENERNRLDAEMSRRLSDQQNFFERLINESLSPKKDTSSIRLEERAARLEQRIADAERRFAESEKISTKNNGHTERQNDITSAEMSNPRIQSPPSPAASKSSSSTSTRRKRPSPLGLPSAVQPLLRERFLALLSSPNGPLLDSPQCALRVSVDHIDSESNYICKLRIQNISSFIAHDLKLQVFSDDAHYNSTVERLCIAALGNTSKKDLEPNRYRDLEVSAQCKAPFVVPPEMTLRFELDGRRHAYALRLPIAATSFAKPDHTSAKSIDTFTRKWQAASEYPEQQLVVSSRAAIDDDLLNDLKHRVIRTACKAALVPNAPSKFIIAAVNYIQCNENPFKVPVLMRLEANAAAKALRITVRSPSQDAAAAIRNILQALITSYFIM